MRAVAVTSVILLLLAATVLMPVLESEPDTLVTAVHQKSWCVTDERLDSSYLDRYPDNYGSIYVSELRDDPDFHRYLQGEIGKPDLKRIPISEGGSYYVFFKQGAVLVSGSHGSVPMDSLDHSVLEGPEPTALYVKGGTYGFTTDADPSMFREVVVKSGEVMQMFQPHGDSLTIRLYSEGTYMIYLSGDGLNKVDFKVESGDVKALSHMSGTVPHALSTSYFWARAEVELEPGRYSFTNCGFVAGGEYDAKFRSEIAATCLTEMPSWANRTSEIKETTTVAVYGLICAGDCIRYTKMVPAYDSQGNQWGYTGISEEVRDFERIGSSSLPERLTMFAPSNERVTIATTYDMSKYSVMMDAGDKEIFIASDYRYDLEFDVSTQLDLRVEPIKSHVTDGEMFAASILLSTEDIPEPDGWTPLFSALCISSLIALLCILAYAGRRPSWEE